MRQPVDAFDYEKQLIYGADYKDHLHEINALGYIAYTKLRKEQANVVKYNLLLVKYL